MQEKQVRTSWKQRIIIGFIAFLLLFSTVAVYVLIVMNGEGTKKASETANTKLTELSSKLDAKQSEIDALASKMSGQYFDALNDARKDRVKSYNASAVNNDGLKTKDVKDGDGKEIADGDKYYSYYVGWCPDESIFDSSFNSNTDPASLNSPLYYAGDQSLIAGWIEGVVGMKTGGIREITIPGQLAYGDTREICGQKNSPLKFLVYVVDPGEEYDKLQTEYEKIRSDYITAYYEYSQLQQNSSN